MIDLRAAVNTAIGSQARDIEPLSGGCIGQVYRLRLDDGRTVVAKVDDSSLPRLHIEGMMLDYLADNSALPVPDVLHCDERLLLLAFVSGSSQFSRRAEEHAAEQLAALHSLTAANFGFAHPTLIGGLDQPNIWQANWLPFFREQRLLAMARQGIEAGRLPSAFWGRLEAFGACLDEWLIEPERPSLIHGDVWTTNVLAVGDRISAFLDPAIYYAHPEMELAFITLFGTFGSPFFERYQAIYPLKPGFFESRRDIYNLYPLLVHVRLFGGSYVRCVDATLRRFGF